MRLNFGRPSHDLLGSVPPGPCVKPALFVNAHGDPVAWQGFGGGACAELRWWTPFDFKPKKCKTLLRTTTATNQAANLKLSHTVDFSWFDYILYRKAKNWFHCRPHSRAALLPGPCALHNLHNPLLRHCYTRLPTLASTALRISGFCSHECLQLFQGLMRPQKFHHRLV